MSDPYDFQTQLAVGQDGEAFLDAFFRREGFTITPASAAEQRTEIDRWFVDRHERRFSVEYKRDATAGRTGNAFVELWGDVEHRRRGWARMSAAAYLIYYVPEPEAIYVIPMRALRGKLADWALRYPTRRIPNKHWTTEGLLVPLREFERIALKVY